MSAVDTATGVLSIPDVAELDTCAAALAYAEAGWYVGPCYVGPDETRNKHPGSILGNGWHHQTSRDPKQIIAWFAGTSGVGVFLHCGRSGAVVFDVDAPDAMPDVLRDNLAWGPYQSTRPDEPGRGHFPFRMPPGRTLGNSRGKLGKAWGEVRGANGVIVVAPSPHLTGRYEWVSAGTVPALPAPLAELLPDAGPAVDAATDETVADFRARYASGPRPDLVRRLAESFTTAVAAGGSRHEEMVALTCWAARNARAGIYSASTAFDMLEGLFAEAMATSGDTDARRILDRTAAQAEFAGIVAWAVAQALAEDDARIDKIRRDLLDPAPLGVPSIERAGSDDPLAEFDGMAERWAAEAQMLPDRFWDARADLSHIRQAAHSKGCSADLVLHATLARLSAYTSHTIVLPDIIGVPGSLNYFVLAIAPSGLGKSMASSLSGRLLARPEGIHEKPLGSGEGIAENYWGNVTELDEKGKKRVERRQVRHNCFLVADEGEAMAALMDRSGSVLASELRSAWVGQTIGQSNATTERSRIVKQHTYRLGLLMGFQPEKAAQLLADNIGGTPQRFIWTAAVDPNQPIDAPAWPGPFEVPRVPTAALRSHESRGFGGLVQQMMTVDDAITDEVWTEHIRKVRGESVVASLDSHQHLHLLKIGGLLALLEGRLHVTLDDWELARIAWQTSCRVRGNVEAAVRAQEERTEASRVARHAAREHAAEAARGSARGDVERLAKRLGRWVHEQQSAGKTPEDGHPHRDLHHRLKSSERALLDPAISHAIEAGWLDEDDGRYRAGESMPA